MRIFAIALAILTALYIVAYLLGVMLASPWYTLAHIAWIVGNIAGFMVSLCEWVDRGWIRHKSWFPLRTTDRLIVATSMLIISLVMSLVQPLLPFWLLYWPFTFGWIICVTIVGFQKLIMILDERRQAQYRSLQGDTEI